MRPLYSLQILTGTLVVLGEISNISDNRMNVVVILFAVFTLINAMIEFFSSPNSKEAKK